MVQIFNKITWCWVEKLNSYYPREQFEKAAMQYGLMKLVMRAWYMVGYLLTASLLSIIREAIIMFILFASLRAVAGGMHCRTAEVCFVLTGFIIIGGAFLAGNIYLDLVHFIVAFIPVFILSARYAPVGTKSNPIQEKSLRKKLKIKTLKTEIFFLLIAIAYPDIRSYVIAAMLCMVITLLPFVQKRGYII